MRYVKHVCILLGVACSLQVACGGVRVTSDKDEACTKELKYGFKECGGIPFRIAEPYTQQITVYLNPKPSSTITCQEPGTAQIVLMHTQSMSRPGNSIYYIKPKIQLFGKSTLSIKANSDSQYTEINTNSEPTDVATPITSLAADLIKNSLGLSGESEGTETDEPAKQEMAVIKDGTGNIVEPPKPQYLTCIREYSSEKDSNLVGSYVTSEVPKFEVPGTKKEEEKKPETSTSAKPDPKGSEAKPDSDPKESE